MRRRVAVAAMLLLLPLEAWACPVCAYDRMLFNWGPKMLAIKLVVAVAATMPRLNTVRVLCVFLPFVVVQWTLYKQALWHAFPGNSPLEEGLGDAGLCALNLGLPDLAMILILGKIRLFRWRPDRGLAWWHPIAYLALLVSLQSLFLPVR